jgi:DNA ligase-associated metallophosphoesterase
MSSRNGARTEIADEILLDGRLALFHQKQRWLAVADLHFGFELSQRAAGNLFPLWGMQTIQTRIDELLDEYRPVHLILLGDLVHDRTASAAFAAWARDLGAQTNVVLISGNHDRDLMGQLNVLSSWCTDGFVFHHGHCEMETGEIQIIGHHHPAHVVRDGAGLRLKLPAFVQQDRCWIMPAFSPWAAGTVWPEEEGSRVWLCSPNRIISMIPA